VRVARAPLRRLKISKARARICSSLGIGFVQLLVTPVVLVVALEAVLLAAVGDFLVFAWPSVYLHQL
jgi:hypothetical protein